MEKVNIIFQKMENSLRIESDFSEREFNSKFGEFKNYTNRNLSDNEIYQLLVMIIFYSGFRSSIIEKKKIVILNHFKNFNEVANYDESMIQEILLDKKMIRNIRKIRSAVKNALIFKEIIKEFGSFNKYLIEFNGKESFENLILLKEELQYKFDYLGKITVYHFLTDLGYNVLKPDRVIQRIFKRLGFIENEKQLLKSVIIGRKFAIGTKKPIRYIDILLVKYGQKGKSEEFGLNNGICLKINPQCEKCGVFEYCKFEKKRKNTGGNKPYSAHS